MQGGHEGTLDPGNMRIIIQVLVLIVLVLGEAGAQQNTTLCASRCNTKDVEGVFYGECAEHKRVHVGTCYSEEGVYIVTPFYSYTVIPVIDPVTNITKFSFLLFNDTRCNSTVLYEVPGACSHPGCCPTIFLTIDSNPIFGFIVEPQHPPLVEHLPQKYYVIGGVVVGAVVIAVIGLVLILRRRKRLQYERLETTAQIQ